MPSQELRASGPDAPAPPFPAGALALLATAQLLVGLDYSIVYVALPTIEEALRFPVTELQWVVSAYAVFFAGFLLVCGRLVDALGARRVFLGALYLLTAASLGAGLAADPAQLIVARAFQGIGAAALAPATLALLTHTFAAGPRRDRALTVWSTAGAAGLAVGVLGGGVLTHTASWRWIFLAVALVAAVMAGTAGLVLPKSASRAPTWSQLSLGRALLLTAGVLFAVLGLSRGTDSGWGHTSELLLLVVSVASFVCFAVLERRADVPLVPRALLRRRPFVVACAAAALFMGSFGAEFYVVTLLMDEVHHYSPVTAGLAFLPLAAAAPIGSALTSTLIRRVGAARTLVAGFAVGALGIALLLPMSVESSYSLTVLPGLLVSGFGQGVAYTAAFGLGTSALDEQRGIGSALITTVQYFGGSLGLAALVAVMGDAPAGAHARSGLLLLAAVALAAVALVVPLRRGGSSLGASEQPPDAPRT